MRPKQVVLFFKLKGIVLSHGILEGDDAVCRRKRKAAPGGLGMSDLWRVMPAHGTHEH